MRKSVFPPPIHLFRVPGRPNRDRVWWQGKWHYLGVSGSPEARQGYARLLCGWADTPVPEPPRPAGLSVQRVVAAWDLHARKVYSAEGREREQYARGLRVLVRLFGNTRAEDFRAAQLVQVQEAMA